MTSFELIPFMFPQIDWDAWVQFGDFPPLPNYYSYFITHILCFDNQWLANFKRFCQRRRVDGQNIWMVKIVIVPEVLEEYGCCVNSALASDISAKRLVQKLYSSQPMFFMPRYIIGYPNARGHCYLIAPLILILHCQPIIWAIISGMELSAGSVNAGEVVARKRYSLDEFPFYWIRMFWKIIRNYHKLSSSDKLSLDNIPALRVAIASNTPPCYPEGSVDADLQLDRDLINNLCASLRDFCDDAYGTPGGQSALTYIDLMQKLSYDIPGFRERFFLKLRVAYFCRFCPRGPFSDDFYFPVLSIPPSQELEDIFYDLSEIIREQDMSCRQLVDGAPCGHVLDRFESAGLLNLPEVICFYVQRGKDFKSVSVPDEIVVSFKDQPHVYVSLGSTVCFKCYEDANGVPYGSFYHEKVDGDKRTTAHVITHLRTQNQFVEINNGKIYECDQRILQRTTPGSLHLYQRKEYSSLLSNVLSTEIKPAPYK